MIKWILKISLLVIVLGLAVYGFTQIKNDVSLDSTGNVIHDLKDAGNNLKDVVNGAKNTADKVKEIQNNTKETANLVKEKTSFFDKLKDKFSSMLGIVDTQELINEIINLRSSQNDKLKIAEEISLINDKVTNADDPKITSAWQETLTCAYDNCNDEYILLIDAVALHKLKDNNKLIHSTIETYKFWDGKNPIYLSESISQTNELVLTYDDKTKDLWKDILDCKGDSCNLEQKTIDLITKVNSYQAQ